MDGWAREGAERNRNSLIVRNTPRNGGSPIPYRQPRRGNNRKGHSRERGQAGQRQAGQAGQRQARRDSSRTAPRRRGETRQAGERQAGTRDGTSARSDTRANQRVARVAHDAHATATDRKRGGRENDPRENLGIRSQTAESSGGGTRDSRPARERQRTQAFNRANQRVARVAHDVPTPTRRFHREAPRGHPGSHR